MPRAAMYISTVSPVATMADCRGSDAQGRLRFDRGVFVALERGVITVDLEALVAEVT